MEETAKVIKAARDELIRQAAQGEVLHNLYYPRLKLNSSRISRFLSDIRKAGVLVVPGRTLKISRDESDNRFYECAEAGKADFLVTGNTRHFPVNHKGTKIVTPRELVEHLGPLLTGGVP